MNQADSQSDAICPPTDESMSLWDVLPWFLFGVAALAALCLAVALIVLLHQARRERRRDGAAIERQHSGTHQQTQKKETKKKKKQKKKQNGEPLRTASVSSLNDGSIHKRSLPHLCATSPRGTLQSISAAPTAGGESQRFTRREKKKRKSNIGVWEATDFRRSMSVDRGLDLFGPPGDRESTFSVDSFEPATYANLEHGEDEDMRFGVENAGPAPAVGGNNPWAYRNADLAAHASSGSERSEASSAAMKNRLLQQHPLFARRDIGRADRATIRMSGMVPLATPEQSPVRVPRGCYQNM